MAPGNGRNGGFGKRELRQLYGSFGTHDLFNSGNFNPLTRNLTTGKILNRGHHCERCESKMTKACFEDFHYAFCPTFVTRNGSRVRCGERLALRSDGCGEHKKCKGYNRPLYRAAKGEDVDLSEFDDPEPWNLVDEPKTGEHDYEREKIELAELIEDVIRKKGSLPPNFEAEYWAVRKIEKTQRTIENAGSTAHQTEDSITTPAKGKILDKRITKQKGITFAVGAGNKNEAARDSRKAWKRSETYAVPSPRGAKSESPIQDKGCSDDSATSFAKQVFCRVLGKKHV
jgi:hypothetical protein